MGKISLIPSNNMKMGKKIIIECLYLLFYVKAKETAAGFQVTADVAHSRFVTFLLVASV